VTVKSFASRRDASYLSKEKKSRELAEGEGGKEAKTNVKRGGRRNGVNALGARHLLLTQMLGCGRRVTGQTVRGESKYHRSEARAILEGNWEGKWTFPY